MKRLGTALLLILLAVACARPGAAPAVPAPGEGVDLRYGFEPGSRYAIRAGIDVTASARGSDASVAETVEGTGEARQALTLDLSQSFHAGEGETLEMVTVVDDVRLEAWVADEPRTLPPEVLAGLRGMRLDATVDRRGRVDTEAADPAGPEGLDPGAAIGLGASLPTLPEDTLAVGASFTHETESTLPAGTLLGADGTRVRLTARYTLRKVRGGRALFDVTTTLASADSETLVSVEGEGGGRAAFEVAGGYFAELELGQAITVTVPAPSALTLRMNVDVTSSTTPLP